MRLAAIVVVGFALRLAYLLHVALPPSFRWHDPDFYLRGGRQLAEGPHGWHWTFDAVTISIAGRRHVLPPLYPVFLSIFASFPYLPLTALLGQLVLSLAAIVLIFELGRRLHSPRAGLIAAGSFSVWALNIFNVWSTSQETLYIPLIVLGFVLVAKALATSRRRDWFLAGVGFGFAALTRSMPLFFLPLAAVLHVGIGDDRRRALKDSTVLLAGLALPTVPYVLALSLHMGQFTPIDSHGSIHVSQDAALDDRALSVSETLGALSATIADSPLKYLQESAERARSLLHINGGRVLQIYVTAQSRATAILWKIALHLAVDLLVIAVLILAPFGVAFARNRPLAAFFVLWILVNLGIASVGGFGGARLRAPVEPMLLVLASVVVAGNWRPTATRRPMVLAAVVSVILAAVAIPQVPRSLRAWPSYGVSWSDGRQSGRFRGVAGFNVLAGRGSVAFRLTRTFSRPSAGDAHVTVKLRGQNVEAFELAPRGSRDCRYPWPDRDLVYVEVDARRLGTGDAVALAVTPLRSGTD
jgi:hypothetical protein